MMAMTSHHIPRLIGIYKIFPIKDKTYFYHIPIENRPRRPHMAWLFGAAGAGAGRARGVASPRRRNEAGAVAESREPLEALWTWWIRFKQKWEL
jgi:hypothetical protein